MDDLERPPERVMVDPSLLLSFRWFEKLGDLNPAEYVASATFVQGLRNLDIPFPTIEAWGGFKRTDAGLFTTRVDLLLSWLDGVTLFTANDRVNNQADLRVQEALLRRPTWMSVVHADEWAFLETRSTMMSRWRRPIDAFARAGAAVVTYGRRLRDEWIQVAIPAKAIPPTLTPTFLGLVSAKWLVIGGAAAAGGALGGPAGALVGLPTIPFVRAFDE